MKLFFIARHNWLNHLQRFLSFLPTPNPIFTFPTLFSTFFYRKIPAAWTGILNEIELVWTGLEKKTKIESCLWPGERVLKVEIILHQMVNVGSQIKWTYWEVKCHFFIKFLITKCIFKNFDPMILFLKENKKNQPGEIRTCRGSRE